MGIITQVMHENQTERKTQLILYVMGCTHIGMKIVMIITIQVSNVSLSNCIYRDGFVYSTKHTNFSNLAIKQNVFTM